MSEYKKIVLLIGLEGVDDYQFRTIKSLLRKNLNLTKKMQDDYDRIQLADLMEDTFPKDSGLDKLIEVCQSIKELEQHAKKLKTEKAKVKNQNKGKNKTALKKTEQDEPSSSQSLSTNNESNENKPSSKKKRKQSMKTEGGKKGKLTQEQTRLPEPSGSIPQINEVCLQTPPKPPPTPSSSSSNKKKRGKTIKTDGGKKREFTEEKNQLPEPSGSNAPQNEGCIQTFHEPPPTLSSSSSIKKQTIPQLQKMPATGNSSEGKFQTLQGLSATASSSLQAPQTPLEAGFLLKTSQGSPAPLVQNFSMSPTSDSSIKLNSHVLLTQSSSVHVPPVPSARASSDVWVLPMSSGTVSRSLSAAQTSPVLLSSSAQNFHPPTVASFNSTQIPHSPQVTASRSVQTPNVPSETLKIKAQVINVPPETASSHVQVSHVLPEANTCTVRVPQRAASNSIQFLNSPTVKEPGNAMVSVPLTTGPTFFLASLESPATASSRFQVSQVLPATTSKSLPAPQMPIPIEKSRAQTTDVCTGTAANFIQVLHASPPRVSRNVCAIQVPHEVPFNTGQALSYPKVKASKSVHAPPVPSVAASKSLLASCTSTPTTSRNLLAPQMSVAATFSDLQVPPATASCSTSRTPKGRDIPKEPSREEGHHEGPKEVMVLRATEAFIYDLNEDKRMFHATVATESEFFRVKVFDTDLKNKFIPKKIIAISNYIGFNGFLEIHRASCVSDVNVNQKMTISNALRQTAIATPKIKNLFSQTNGTYVDGVFVVIKKNERNDLIYYWIGDDTGTMEVVVYGRLTSIKCEPGNKLHLVCFELTSNDNTWQLRSARHSYMQVISVNRKDTQS